MYTCVLPLPRQEEAMKIAGIDVHKKVLVVVVVVVDARAPEEKPARRRFVYSDQQWSAATMIAIWRTAGYAIALVGLT